MTDVVFYERLERAFKAEHSRSFLVRAWNHLVLKLDFLWARFEEHLARRQRVARANVSLKDWTPQTPLIPPLVWRATYNGVVKDVRRDGLIHEQVREIRVVSASPVIKELNLFEGTLPPVESTFNAVVFRRVGLNTDTREVCYQRI